MSDRGWRIVALNGVLLILTGLLLAGFPLVWVVAREVYGQSVPVHLPGDYRGWNMAHLEGILNGLMIIALAGVTRSWPLKRSREAWLVPALVVTGWGNVGASITAALFGVRAISFNGDAANDILCGVFYIAFVGTIIAFATVALHLVRAPAARG